MPRPQVVVTITAALPRRGQPTATGTAFLVYTAASGPDGPQRFTSPTDAAAALSGNAEQWAVDAFAEGAPEVVTVRATAVDAAAVTTAEWTTALDSLTTLLGQGQVLIPGVTDAAAHSALLTHSAATGRTALLDVDGDASDIVAAVNALASGDNAGAFTPVIVPASADTTREVPGSVIAAGLAARGDARVGHTNHAPAGTHSGGAGVSRLASDAPAFTESELDSLYDAGVNVFAKQAGGGVVLQGWKSVSANAAFAQLNVGRLVMKLRADFSDRLQSYLYRQIDGRGHLYGEVEGDLRGYLLQLWEADALFGDVADDAYDVQVAEINTDEDVAAGRLRAAAEIAASLHVERVVFDIVLHAGQEVAA